MKPRKAGQKGRMNIDNLIGKLSTNPFVIILMYPARHTRSVFDSLSIDTIWAS